MSETREGAFARVGSLAILFTDLHDSTALRARAGDPAAFGRVMRHFQVMGDAVVASGGTVVRTIGDAVMAVFPTAEQALVRKAGVHSGKDVVLSDRVWSEPGVRARLQARVALP